MSQAALHYLLPDPNALKRCSILSPFGMVDRVSFKSFSISEENFYTKSTSLLWLRLVAIGTDLQNMVVHFCPDGVPRIKGDRERLSEYCLRKWEKKRQISRLNKKMKQVSKNRLIHWPPPIIEKVDPKYLKWSSTSPSRQDIRKPCGGSAESTIMWVISTTDTYRSSVKGYKNLSICSMDVLAERESQSIASSSPSWMPHLLALHPTMLGQEYENLKSRKLTRCLTWTSLSWHKRNALYKSRSPPKNNRSPRFWAVYRKINGVTVEEGYPIAQMNECIDSIGCTTTTTC